MKKYLIIFGLLAGIGFLAAWYLGYIPGTTRDLVRKILDKNKNNPDFKETKDSLMKKDKATLQKMIDSDLAATFQTA